MRPAIFPRSLSRVASDARRGSALLVVLAMLGMIAALTIVISRSVSGSAFAVSTERDVLQSGEDMRAGIELGAAGISKLGDDMRSADVSTELTDRRLAVRITNERGRIDLNFASVGTLTALFQIGGIENSDASGLAAKVVEWRGGSASQKLDPLRMDEAPKAGLGFQSLVTQPSAELRQGPKQSLGTRFFLHPMQLAAVPGFSAALVQATVPFVTVASGSDKLDPYITPDQALEFLPGSSADKATAFIEARDGNTSRKTAIQLLGLPDELVTSKAAPGWRLQITSTHRSGRVHRGEVVIAIIKGDSAPYRVLYAFDGERQ
jgi:type II secretory pathway component PulK